MARFDDLHEVKGGCVPISFLVLGPIENNVYLIDDGAGGVIVVDPSCEPDLIMDALAGRPISALFVTHQHWDHVGALRALVDRTGAAVYASRIDAPTIESGQADRHSPERISPCRVDHKLSDGESVTVGMLTWRCILTPGHTKGSMCLLAETGTRPGSPVLISGDTLFQASIGRVDFEGGSMTDMRASLRKLSKLPDDTIVLPGHMGTTTIGAERHRVIEALM